MQGGNQIVKPVAFIIKARAALASNLGQQFRLQHPLARVIALGHIGHHFQGIQRPSRVAVYQLSNGLAGFIRQNDILAAIAASFIVHRLVKHPLDIVGGQRFQ